MAKYPEVDMKDYEKGDLKKLNELEKMFQSAKEARKGRIPRWRRNEELYAGDILKPFNLPKYKTRIEPNIIHSIVETMFAILTDRAPAVDIMPKREEQVDSAKMAQEAVESIMEGAKFQRAVAMMKRDGLIFGNGFIKITMQDGDIDYSVTDPYTVFIDPLATNLQNAQCVIFATPTYVDDIYDLYGKRVGAEGKINEYKSFIKFSDKYATDKVNLAELDAVSPLDRKEGSDYRGGQALLKESFYRTKDGWRLATWAGKVLLQDVESPYDFLPLIMFQNYQSAHSVWGKGEPEVVESLATGSAIALSQGMDNLIMHGNPAVIMSKSLAKTQGNRPTDRPGQIFYTNGPHERIDRMSAGNISASTLPMSESMIQLADTVSGVHDITQGRNPKGVTASRAISQLQEASQQIIRAKEREIGTDAIIDAYKITLQMLNQNYEQAISIRIATDDGGYGFRTIAPYDIDFDMDFKYIPGSSLPESRGARFDQAIDLLQLGLLDQEQFWRWTQKDISKDVLEGIIQQKQMQQQQLQAEMDTLQNSTNEDEIMDALLRQRETSGIGRQTDENALNSK
tara:strand:+ start:902 stop:2608 length:1707 start_codon:yes stop_codon:yes gene_type:complete